MSKITLIKIVYCLQIFLFCSSFFNVSSCVAQTTTIQKRIYLQGSKNAYSRDIIETSPGNFVLIGQSFDSTAGQIENHLTLAGVDNNGSVNWRKSYGGNKFKYNAIIGTSRYIIKSNGSLYLPAFALDSNNRTPGVFVKFNYNGDTIWQKKYYHSNPRSSYFFTSACPSVDNGFLITGALQIDSPAFNNHPTVGLCLIKTDHNGVKLWDKILYKNNLDQTQTGYDIIQDSSTKKIVVIGYQDKTGGGSSNVVIFDSLGNILTQKGAGSEYFGDGLTTLIQTRDGNFISCASVGYPFFNSEPTERSFLIKFDVNANVLFKKEYDTISLTNAITRISELSDGSLITGGVLEMMYRYNYKTNNLLRIMKLDKNGNMIWKKYFDNYTDGHNEDALLGLTISSAQDIAFTSFCDCPEPAPLTFMFYRTDTISCDVNAVYCYDITGISDLQKNIDPSHVQIFPNPATDRCTVTFSNQYTGKSRGIEMRNSLGELVFSDRNVNVSEYKLNVEMYPAGVYYLGQLLDNQLISEQKLIILHEKD